MSTFLLKQNRQMIHRNRKRVHRFINKFTIFKYAYTSFFTCCFHQSNRKQQLICKSIQNPTQLYYGMYFIESIHIVAGCAECLTKMVYDDAIKWKHFPRYWPFVRGIHRSPVNSPHKVPVTRSFDVYFDLRPDKRLSKQSWGWWFETLSHSLWRHRNATNVF